MVRLEALTYVQRRNTANTVSIPLANAMTITTVHALLALPICTHLTAAAAAAAAEGTKLLHGK